MAQRRLYRYDEARFKPGQKPAAIALVEREFMPKGERKTMQEIADEVGISRKALYNWNTKDENFIEFKKYLSAQLLDSHMPMVYARLVESIDKRYSVRAMELFMKRAGDLADQQDITIHGAGEQKEFGERKADLLARLEEAEADANEEAIQEGESEE